MNLGIKEFYVKPTEKEIKEYIISDSFKEYVDKMKSELGIEKYQVDIHLFENQKIRLNPSALATIRSTKDFCETNGVYINVRRIAEKCSSTFEVFINNRDIYLKIIKVYVRLAIVHELIHVQQIKNGLLNEEIEKIEIDKPYNVRIYEKEALEKADYIIGNSNTFSQAIIQNMNAKYISEAVKGLILSNQNTFS